MRKSLEIMHSDKYNTRPAAKQSYYLPFVRTNYGKFNIRFQGPSIWNCIDKDIKLVVIKDYESAFDAVQMFIQIP